MELKSDIQERQQKVYNSNAMGLGTLIGGPLAAGYFLAQNYKVFNESGKARKTWIIAVAVMIAILCYFLFVTILYLNPIILLIIIAAIVWILGARLQGENIRAHVHSGGLIHGWLRTTGVALAGLLATIILILSLSALKVSFSKSSITFRTYGILNNEIAFDKKNITELEVDEIGDAFINASYFNDSFTKYVFAKKIKDAYELSLAIPEDLVIDTTAIRLFKKLKTDMQNSFPDKKINLNLVSGDLKNVLSRIE